jgi:hypothetical protein
MGRCPPGPPSIGGFNVGKKLKEVVLRRAIILERYYSGYLLTEELST